MTRFLLLLLAIFAVLSILACPCDAAAPQTWADKDSAGAAATVEGGYLMTLVVKDGPLPPYVCVHGRPGGAPLAEHLPPIAVIVDDGEIRLQLADSKWFDNISLKEVIAAVKKAKKTKTDKPKVIGTKTSQAEDPSPFKLAAWGRGCPSCVQGQPCTVEAVVAVTKTEPAKVVSVCPACPANHDVGPLTIAAAAVRSGIQIRQQTTFMERGPLRRGLRALYWRCN